jgi:hypothetical protein
MTNFQNLSPKAGQPRGTQFIWALSLDIGHSLDIGIWNLGFAHWDFND